MPMKTRKGIALVARDHKKQELLDRAKYHRRVLLEHDLHGTGRNGALMEQELGIPVKKLRSSPLGVDQQRGARIVEGDLDVLMFFWDPLQPLRHNPDVKALLRIAVVGNISWYAIVP